jgi:hypothetical protein
LTLIDLIENSASLIQYKMSSGNDFPSWTEFSRWSKRNPSYTRIIAFVRDFIGDANLALRIFCPLVQVAFETNRPIQAFAILLGAFKYNYQKGFMKEIVNQPEPCRWLEVFDLTMNKMPFDEPEYGSVWSKRFFRLDRYDTFNFRIGDKLPHPILGHFMKLWGEFEKRDRSFRYAFTAPNGYARQIGEIIGLFHAPITILKFTIANENVIQIFGDLNSSGLANVSGIAFSEKDVRGAFVDFLAIYGIVRRHLNALMDPDFRLCHHKDCPLYNGNVCNTWIFVPKRFEDCTFVSRVGGIREWTGSSPLGTKTEWHSIIGDADDGEKK